VPLTQRTYRNIAHSQFVTAWPLLTPQQLHACYGNRPSRQAMEVPGVEVSEREQEMQGLPGYARDLVCILRGGS